MRALAVTLLIMLVVLHQDFWWWDDPSLILGFLPVGLAWHAGLSLAAGLVWVLAVRACWPRGLEVEERKGEDAAPARAGETDR